MTLTVNPYRLVLSVSMAIAAVQSHAEGPFGGFDVGASFSKYSGSPASNSKNPWDEVGVVHNVILNFTDSTLDGDGERPTKPSGETLRTKVLEVMPFALKECKNEALRRGEMELAHRVLAGMVSGKGPRDFGEFIKDRLERQQYRSYADRLMKLIKGTAEPQVHPVPETSKYWACFEPFRRLESDILSDRKLGQAAKAVLLGSSSVARHSGYYWCTGSDAQPGLSNMLASTASSPVPVYKKGWLKKLIQNTFGGGSSSGGGGGGPSLWSIVVADASGLLYGAAIGGAIGTLGGTPGQIAGLIIGGLAGGAWCSTHI